MQIGKDEHHRGSIIRPRRDPLPRKILLDALRPSLITAPVSLLVPAHRDALSVRGAPVEPAQIDLLFGAWLRCLRPSGLLCREQPGWFPLWSPIQSTLDSVGYVKCTVGRWRPARGLICGVLLQRLTDREAKFIRSSFRPPTIQEQRNRKMGGCRYSKPHQVDLGIPGHFFAGRFQALRRNGYPISPRMSASA